MKKILLTCFIIILLSALFCSTYASTNTQERTSTNLHVTKNISVISSNKQAILKTPYVDASEKIYDFADLFSDEEEQNLYEQAMNFIEKKNLDIVIVTIDENNKSSSMAYADDFYDYNDFGIGEDYSGILLLIDMDTRNIWISTTGEAIKKYTDSKIDDILDEIQPYAKKANYYDCAKEFIHIAQSQDFYTFLSYICIGIIIAIIIASIFCVIFASKHKPVKLNTSASNYLDKSSLKITNRQDSFVSTHTSRTPISSSSSSGGSSSHSGSSGISHGGGGRSF